MWRCERRWRPHTLKRLRAFHASYPFLGLMEDTARKLAIAQLRHVVQFTYTLVLIPITGGAAPFGRRERAYISEGSKLKARVW